MGAVILQEGAPIAYASKTLTESQVKYAQIEKEALAISYGCQRFHQYLYGKTFVVETDHKPLESIFKKPLDKCPMRLQRIRINLQQYNFNVKYKQGKQLYFADTLSRASHEDKNFDLLDKEIECHINLLIETSPASPGKLNEIRIETENDTELLKLKQQILNGWPKNKNKVESDLKLYWKIRDELNIIDNIIYKGNKIVIPKIMRKDIKNRIHYNHMGINKTLLRANDLVYWPFMSSEIINLVKNCPTCLKYQRSQRKETFVPRKLSDRPWEQLATDLFEHKNQHFLLLVDAFSKYPEVVNLNTTTADVIIQNLKEIFARHGKPEVIFSDNGPQFGNYKIKQFFKQWEIKHQTSTPHYPQSNGLIERHVQTIKKLIKKAINDEKDISLTLLEYRTTPISTEIPTPAELLFGRKIKGHLPVPPFLLKPKYDVTNVKTKFNQNYISQQQYYNLRAKNLPELEPNDHIMVQHQNLKVWEPGRVVQKDATRPRSYVIQQNNNKHYVRNRKFLQKHTNMTLYAPVTEDLEVETPLITPQATPTSPRPLSPLRDFPPEREEESRVEVTDSAENSGSVNNSEKAEPKTRYGRTIKRPSYWNDYYVSQ